VVGEFEQGVGESVHRAGDVPHGPGALSRRLRELAAERENAALFFDVDGVLAPICPLPGDAAVPEPVREALSRLVRSFRLVAVVSGRSAHDVALMLAVAGVTIAGDHGATIVQDGVEISSVPPELLGRLEAAARRLAFDGRLQEAGVRVEVKAASIALHSRGAADLAEAMEVAAAAAEAAAAAFDLVHHRGRAVVDLRSPDADKGSAVRRLVLDTGVRAALYVGDDRTDIDAMQALRLLEKEGTAPLRSLLVGVASDEMPSGLAEAADFLISQSEVLSLLRALERSSAEAP